MILTDPNSIQDTFQYPKIMFKSLHERNPKARFEIIVNFRGVETLTIVISRLRMLSYTSLTEHSFSACLTIFLAVADSALSGVLKMIQLC